MNKKSATIVADFFIVKSGSNFDTYGGARGAENEPYTIEIRHYLLCTEKFFNCLVFFSK